ncbi:MAG: MerR family transcriptional regulator [Ruminococcus sp.]|jgi:MerR family transcriptional activator of bmr gene
MYEGFYSIGEVSKVLDISIPTIRHYEKMNLIKPAYIDPSSKYRYYDMVDFWDLEVIRICRNLGFSLKEIEKLKKSESLEDLIELTHVLKFRVRREIMRCQSIYENLNWLEKKWIRNQRQNENPQKEPVCQFLPARHVLEVSLDDVEESYKKENHFIQISRLHLELQKLYREVLEQSYSYRVDFGYEISLPHLKKGNLYIKSEWAHIEDYSMLTSTAKLVTLPAGNYVCFLTYLWKDDTWKEVMKEYMERRGLIPRKIYAEEVALYPYQYTDTCHEVRILAEKERDTLDSEPTSGFTIRSEQSKGGKT